MRFKERLTQLHYRAGGKLSPWLWPLLPLSAFYGLGVWARLKAYEKGWLLPSLPPVSVISVGNLTTGGTGKTPLVIALARGLVQAGKTVVILSRGYGAKEPQAYARAVDPNYGDEAFLMQQQMPEAVVIVGRNRVATLHRAVHDYRPDYVLLDDGFQYIRLQRDINILLLDGDVLLGNGLLLPAGPLREPMSQIKRADMIFVTKTVSTEALQTVERWVRQYHPKVQIPVLPVAFHPVGLRRVGADETIPLENLAGRAVVAFSGIARPERFEQDLRDGGLQVLQTVRFDDHHAYTETDVQRLSRLLEVHQADAPVWVTTEKDVPKLRPLLSAAQEASLYTLQTLPAFDGRWFYDEFLTQMPGYIPAGDDHVQSGHGP